MCGAFFLLGLALYFTLFVTDISGVQLNPDGGEVQVSSQVYQPHAALRVETNLVQIDVVVRDKHGRAVFGLDRSNFKFSTKEKNATSRPFLWTKRIAAT